MKFTDTSVNGTATGSSKVPVETASQKGNLTLDQIKALNAPSAADITDASASGKAVLTGTPAQGREALGILPSMMEARKIFVSFENGNDATGEISNPTKPFQTANAAFAACLATGQVGSMPFRFDFDYGDYTLSLTSYGSMPENLMFTGKGHATALIIVGEGAAGNDIQNNGGDFGGGTILSDFSIAISAYVSGGPGYTIESGVAGNGGSLPSTWTLINCAIDQISFTGGVGGASGFIPGDSGGNGGNIQEIVLNNCRPAYGAPSSVTISTGLGGSGEIAGLPGTLNAAKLFKTTVHSVTFAGAFGTNPVEFVDSTFISCMSTYDGNINLTGTKFSYISSLGGIVHMKTDGSVGDNTADPLCTNSILISSF